MGIARTTKVKRLDIVLFVILTITLIVMLIQTMRQIAIIIGPNNWTTC
jgi:hypothetical protein